MVSRIGLAVALVALAAMAFAPPGAEAKDDVECVTAPCNEPLPDRILYYACRAAEALEPVGVHGCE